MLHWKAYGFCYGIPKSNYDALSSGQSVVANVSRSVISQARLLYQPLTIIHVTASRDILQKRLTKRGRENDINIDSRLRYANQIVPVGNDVVTIHNNSLLMDATRKFIDVLNTNTCAPPENQSTTGR